MKSAPFEYHKPATLAEALALLAELGEEAKVLAGGQSLVPMMALRLARPGALIDVNALAALAYARESEGTLALGALLRQRALERSDIAARWPLVRDALPLVGHIQTRNRGTIGGSLAHADPAAELPAVALALDAQLVAASAAAERSIPAKEFFLGAYTTALRPDEMLVEVRLPPWPSDRRHAVLEVSPHHGAFAIAGAAVALEIDGDGRGKNVRVALFGVDHAPRRAERAEKRLEGERLDDGALSDAAREAMEEVDPYDDVQASAAYRRHLAGVLVDRALGQALGSAKR